MRAGLGEWENFKEQIRLISRINNVDSTIQINKRITELSKKDYILVDTYIDEQEQLYILEKKRAE